MAAPLIQFRDVSKTYDGLAAVEGVSLDIPAGQFVAVVGASGSGKTTLTKMVNRLVEPNTGQVLVEGADVAAQDAVQLRRRIGYVFQGVGLFPHLKVAENIAITPRLLKWPGADIAPRVAELLDLVGLPQAYADRRPDQLSGGERQRVGVARALAASPAILLMDEPFGALDPITREALGRSTRALHDRLGLTTLMVTHDVQEALLLADRILVMAGGKLLADASPRELLKGHPNPAVAALIDTPARQARALSALMGAGA